MIEGSYGIVWRVLRGCWGHHCLRGRVFAPRQALDWSGRALARSCGSVAYAQTHSPRSKRSCCCWCWWWWCTQRGKRWVQVRVGVRLWCSLQSLCISSSSTLVLHSPPKAFLFAFPTFSNTKTPLSNHERSYLHPHRPGWYPSR